MVFAELVGMEFLWLCYSVNRKQIVLVHSVVHQPGAFLSHNQNISKGYEVQ